MPVFKFSTFTQQAVGVTYTLLIGEQSQTWWDGTFVIVDQGPPRIVSVRGEIDTESGVLAFSGVAQGDDYALAMYGKYDGNATITGYLYITVEEQRSVHLNLTGISRKRR